MPAQPTSGQPLLSALSTDNREQLIHLLEILNSQSADEKESEVQDGLPFSWELQP